MIRKAMPRTRKDTTNAESRQRRAMQARDFQDGKPFCRFEKLTKQGWRECGKRTGSILCHLIKRPHLNDACKFHPDLVIAGCPECHEAFDDSTKDTVRAPYDRAALAWYLATVDEKTRCKAAPPKRYDPLCNPLYLSGAA